MELSGGPERFVFVAQERETFVGVVQVMDARGLPAFYGCEIALVRGQESESRL